MAQAVGGSLFNDPMSSNPNVQGTAAVLGMPYLGGGMFTDPMNNPAYVNSGQAQANEYAINHRGATAGGTVGAGAGNQYQAPGIQLVPGGYITPGAGNQFHAGAPPAQGLSAPAVQPPQVNWGLINQMLQGSGGSGGPPTYSSNITAGPIWGPQQTADATASIAAGGAGNLPAAPGMVVSGDQQASMNQQAAQSGQAQTSQAATAFGRNAAQANAQMQLQSQQARAQQGVSLANFLTTIQGNNFSQQQQQRSLLQAILSQLGPMAGL